MFAQPFLRIRLVCDTLRALRALASEALKEKEINLEIDLPQNRIFAEGKIALLEAHGQMHVHI